MTGYSADYEVVAGKAGEDERGTALGAGKI